MNKVKAISLFILSVIFFIAVKTFSEKYLKEDYYRTSIFPNGLPEEGDIMYVSQIKEGIYCFDFYEPKRKKHYKNWKRADSLAGIENRYSDEWHEIAIK